MPLPTIVPNTALATAALRFTEELARHGGLHPQTQALVQAVQAYDLSGVVQSVIALEVRKDVLLHEVRQLEARAVNLEARTQPESAFALDNPTRRLW